MSKIISVHYTQLNSHSCLRETYHNENMVSVETLEQSNIPLEVQRLMLMPKRSVFPDPTFDMLSKFSMEEVAKLHGYDRDETVEEG